MKAHGHIYIMRVDADHVKVGVSIDLARRSRELGGLPLLHSSEWLDRAALLEKSVHRLLKMAGKHVEREVFKASVDEALSAIGKAIEIAEGRELALNALPSNRVRQSISLSFDPELIEALDAWIARQQLRVTRSAAIEAAIRQFLREHAGE